MTIILTFVIGICAGVLSGLLGVGGGIVLVPAMVFILGITQHIAQGISLLVIIPTALSGIWQLQKDKLVNFEVAGFLALGAVFGSVLSASFVQEIPADALRKIFGVFIIISGARMVFKKSSSKQKSN